ncbi:hypothetical protein [Streptomyces clavifer]|uniref:hypothetical protein n=1 Tax=Streptomyces clavifer TaxID=68188 RepID=UPI00382498F7
MALHPEGMFTSGPIAHLVGLAAGGPDPLEWEVLRFTRVTRTDHWDVTWRRTAQPLASQLDYLATAFSEKFFAACPPDARRAWTAAAGPRSVPEFMSELAMLLRLADRQWPAGYDDVPLAQWEVLAQFPLLLALDSWAHDGEHVSYEAALLAYIAAEHPFCYYELIPRVTQALEVGALSTQCDAFAKSFLSLVPAATPETLGTLARVSFAHLTEHHG